MGKLYGIRLYSKGVLVIGKSEVQGNDGKFYKPYEESKIEAGDKILKINDESVETINELVIALSKYQDKDKVNVTYEKGEKILEDQLSIVKSFDDGKNKIGLWVRDGAMGVGTLTFLDPETNNFCALGHGISDSDIKELIDVEKGFLNLANVISIKKGSNGNPGEIRGILRDEEEIGIIEKNNESGIYGKFYGDINVLNRANEYYIASKNEIELGDAKVICTVEPYGIPKEYDISIERIMDKTSFSSKGMIIKVTDEELIEKTGGIIQGMSGSPIIQNGKFIGAVTHVYVNDPTRGYAIFGETMVNELNNIENI